jgi:hypothetical protein
VALAWPKNHGFRFRKIGGQAKAKAMALACWLWLAGQKATAFGGGKQYILAFA